MEAAWKRIGAYVVCRDRDGRVLLTRFQWPGHPDSGMWTLPGGGIEWGESAEMAAVRELAEESGLSAELGPVLGVYSRWYSPQEAFRGEPGHHFGVVFSSMSVAGELRTNYDEDDSTDAAGWFTLSEIRALPLVPLAEFGLDLIDWVADRAPMCRSLRPRRPGSTQRAFRSAAPISGRKRQRPRRAGILRWWRSLGVARGGHRAAARAVARPGDP